MIPRAWLGVSGVVREVLTVGKDYSTTNGGCDTQFCYYTQNENYQALRQPAVSDCTVQMLSGRVVATRHSLKKKPCACALSDS